MMKPGCGTVVFREFELERALEGIRSAGFEYCETQGVGPWCQHVDIRKTDPVKFAALAASYGFREVTALWMPDGNFISNPRSVESAILALRWADAAGIACVNMGDGHRPEGLSEAGALDAMRERLDAVLEATPEVRARLAVEPHGAFSLTLGGLRTILEMAPPERLGVNFDAANIVRASYVESGAEGSGWKNSGNGERADDVLRGVVPRVIHFHAKDIDSGKRCVPLGDGVVPLDECFRILANAGYDGAVSLETEGGMPFDEALSLAKRSREYLRECLKI